MFAVDNIWQTTPAVRGHEVFMLVSPEMLDPHFPPPAHAYPTHWVTYAGNLSVDTTNGNLTFDVYSWGKRITVKNIPFLTFKQYYYGAVSAAY